jgi:hypothetical protein
MVVKARRAHVHTKLAIEKLSTLYVGTLVSSIDHSTPLHTISGLNNTGGVGGDVQPKIPFSADEYRRYALVENTLISPGSGIHGNGDGGCTAVFKLKFCILYPHDDRLGEPKQFLPGQCVEIQMRVPKSKNSRSGSGNSGGGGGGGGGLLGMVSGVGGGGGGGKGYEYVSRYYTPISGSPACFEVLVKVVPRGVLTPFLVKQKCGDRQIRIRGPFGSTSCVPRVPRSVGMNMGSPGGYGFGGNVGGPAGGYGTRKSSMMMFGGGGVGVGAGAGGKQGSDGMSVGGGDKVPAFWEVENLIFLCAGSGLVPALQLIQHVLLPTYTPLYVSVFVSTFLNSQFVHFFFFFFSLVLVGHPSLPSSKPRRDIHASR